MGTNTLDDRPMIQAIIKGDTTAFKTLFEKYYQPLVAYITTFTNDIHLSEDLGQQALITLWNRRSSLNVNKSTKSFLYTIAYNAYIDHYRKQKRRDSFIDNLRLQALQEGILEDTELMDARIAKLKTIVEQLPPRCREILELNKLDGLPYKAIAETLGISLKTVESQMRIAYQKIRKGFEGDPMFLIIIRKVLRRVR
jgi:RNA polymerase sigma-70 factor (ECF subfamily)